MNSSAARITEQTLLQEGLAAVARGDLDIAREKLFSVTENNPRNSEAWIGLSKIATGMAPRFSYLRKAFEGEPDRPENRQILVEFVVRELAPAIRGGNGSEAQKYLFSIVEFFPACEPAWLCLAFSAKTDAEKRKYLENVLRLNPNHRAANEWLASLGPAGENPPQVSLPGNLDIFGNDVFDLSSAFLPNEKVEAPEPSSAPSIQPPPPPPPVFTTPAPVREVSVPPIAAPVQESTSTGNAKWFGIAAAAALVLLIGGGIFFFRPGGGPTPAAETKTDSVPAAASSPAPTTGTPTSAPATTATAAVPVTPPSTQSATPPNEAPSTAKKTVPPAAEKVEKKGGAETAQTAKSPKPAKPAPKGDREDGALVRAH
jgi:hypothetical protein